MDIQKKRPGAKSCSLFSPGGPLDSLPGQRSEWPSVIGCKYQAKMATIRENLAGFFQYLKQTCGRRRVLSVLNQ